MTSPSMSYRSDHPRGCGEHEQTDYELEQIGGSSPRMRGAHVHTLSTSGFVGIIPADAGSTTQRTFPVPYHEDHPRGCGEHTTASVKSSPFLGSSPRMRGARIA